MMTQFYEILLACAMFSTLSLICIVILLLRLDLNSAIRNEYLLMTPEERMTRRAQKLGLDSSIYLQAKDLNRNFLKKSRK